MNNKKLSALIELSSNVKIYVPSTADVDQATDNSAIVDRTLSQLAKMFGGSTQYDALGCWQSATVGLVKEHVVICQSYCSEQQLQDNIDTVIDICTTIKQEMKQEAIALEINNKLYFV